MSAKVINKKKAGQTVLYIVILLLLIGCVGFFAYFTNGFTGDFKSFYVQCNDKTVMSSSDGFQLTSDNPLKVDVCYTFGFMSEEISGYSVTVLPNADFDFTVDGEVHSFMSETNLNNGFDIVFEENSFTISPKGGIQQVLEGVYPGKTIVVDKTQIDFESNLIKINVSSVENKASVSMLCWLNDDAVWKLELDKEEIIF